MIEIKTVPCPECGHVSGTEVLACPHCGYRLRHEHVRRLGEPIVHSQKPPIFEPEPELDSGRSLGIPAGALYLIVGAVLAPLLAVAPILKYMGWFLGSLVHEMGHCISAWFFGCPAFPSIRLDGHAWATHQNQIVFLAILTWGALAYFTWRWRKEKSIAITLGVLAVLYPLLAFTGAREFFFLVSGHVGELAFALLCFWRALTGGFTSSRAERGLYAVCGWFLMGRNVWLAGGLLFSDSVRSWYETSGSLGMKNDYLRLAEDVMGWSLDSVAFFMLALSLSILPLAYVLAKLTSQD
ncbi:MAG: zinc ribbon domain-containing protein [Planctomycetota bacterium]|nr:zinc ribbon domain-containing protein [Planctomycetota bacterium]